MPHFSFIEMVKIALAVLVILGTGRILAMTYPNNVVSQAYLTLY